MQRPEPCGLYLNGLLRAWLNAVGECFATLNRYRVPVTLVFATYAYVRLSWGGITSEELITLFCFSLLHWSAYVFNRFSDWREDSLTQRGEALTQVRSRQIALGLSATCAITPLAVIGYTGLNPWPYMILLLLIPCYGSKIPGTNIRLKSIFLVKNLSSVALAWVAPLIAMEYTTENFRFSERYMVGVLYFAAVVFVYELLWDIRDIRGDLAVGTHTIANRYGTNAARFCALLVCLSLSIPAIVNMGPALSATQVFLLIFVAFANDLRPPWFYTSMPYLHAMLLVSG